MEEGLFFDQVLIYEYSDHTGKSGEIWIYLNSCNHRLLFDQSAWGMEDEMIHYVIGRQDGSYITFGTEAEGSGSGKVALLDSIYLELVDTSFDYPRSDEYVKFSSVEPIQQSFFGLDVKSFNVEKRMDPNAKESMAIARVDFDTRMIYGFNEISQDLQIPHLLGNPHPYLHPNDLIVKYNADYESISGQRYWIKLELIALEYTTYWASINDYVIRTKSAEGIFVEKTVSQVIELTLDCH
ncbi:hypothetical protein MM213_03160 [Belliella sp. R4-6]|uniref:Uncharacterized protein n=1 Tax=Belliella alkalica TaxID=1730871 RepID=A0ABS9V8N2_9BACT|nr:hypothetical protein [Belliella alkalica]MCH7412470.1 hypothetical protein [Belliella alkalica]